MEQTRWDRIATLFWDALDLPPDERAAYLTAQCDDRKVRAEVDAMLAASADTGLKLEQRFVSGDDEALGGLPAGTRIGPYRLIGLAGRGGMGEVYRAERADGEFEQVVAIKLLRPDARSADLVRRFRSERAVMARLVHPNIAGVLDGGTAPDGRPYLVLTFVDGEPITRYALKQPLEQRLRLFVTVARAVQFAHTHLVVHRDIKPSNVLVTIDGQPVLLDFGIAKLLDTVDNPDLTGTGQRLLTPSHAAPEQLQHGPTTTATDVYGLGVLLFEMLTGSRPFSATTAVELERAILDTPAPAPSAAATQGERPAMRGDLDSIVQMALRKEPERRYQTAGELADDIDRYLRGMPVHARPDRWAYRASKFVRRNRAGVIAAGVMFGLVTLATTREAAQARTIAAERDRAVREQAAGEEVLAFVTQLFEQSDPSVVAGGDTMRVTTFLGLAERQAVRIAEPERQMRVYRVLGSVRASRGDYALAESLLALSRDVGAKSLGRDHLEVLRSEQALAMVATDRHGTTYARPLLDSVLQRLRRTVGDNHPDVVTAYIASVAAIDEPDVQQARLDSAVAIRARIGKVDSIEVAASLDKRAAERGARGKYAESVALDETALKILRSRLPENHPSVLTVKGNLAVWLSSVSDWERAVPLAEEILVAAKSQTTPGQGLAIAHERVALMAANMPGKLAFADSMINETLRIYRATVAPEHPLITSSMRNLAIVRSLEGRVPEGLALLDSAIVRDRATGNPDATAYLTGQRVPMLIRLGRNAEAATSAEVAGASRARLPRGSARGADIDVWLGMAALANDRSAEAVSYFSGALEAYASRLPVTHPRRAMVQCALGAALGRAARDDDARAHLREGCPRLKTWGLADPSIVAWGDLAASRLSVR